MNNPRISVIICSCNRAAGLSGLFNDFRAKSAGLPASAWEILFVDNGSTDNTAEIVDRCALELSLPLRYVAEPRRGKSHALNRGVEEAASGFLVFTDDDIILDQAWFAEVLEASERQSYDMFGGRVIAVLPPGMPPWLLDKNNRPLVGGPLVTHDQGDDEREYDASMHRPIGANMFIRRKLFEKLGLFRTDLGPLERGGVYGEDSELALRFMLAGERALYYPRVIVYHPILKDRIRKLFSIAITSIAAGGARALWTRSPGPPATSTFHDTSCAAPSSIFAGSGCRTFSFLPASGSGAKCSSSFSSA